MRRGTTWTYTSFTLSRRDAGSPTAAARLDAALDATARTRAMADVNNLPFAWTPLARQAPSGASCANYASMLVEVLRQANVGIGSRILQVAFNSNPWDRHTLVEAWSAPEQKWILLDPTFSLTLRLATGGSATAEDVSAATRAKDFGRITYVPLDDSTDDRLHGYYFDYPLLFMYIRQNGTFPVQLSMLMQYVAYVATLPGQSVTTPGLYAIESGGILGPVFSYSSISAPPGSAPANVFRPLRFVW